MGTRTFVMKVERGRGVKLRQEDDRRGSTKIRCENTIGKPEFLYSDLKKIFFGIIVLEVL